jgi:hypothetical protein
MDPSIAGDRPDAKPSILQGDRVIGPLRPGSLGDSFRLADDPITLDQKP